MKMSSESWVLSQVILDLTVPERVQLLTLLLGVKFHLTMSSICLRAGWSMGSIKDMYIHYEKAGDQFVGRSATTISSMTKKFAVSPCYFDTTLLDNGQEMERKIDNFLKTYMVSGRVMSAQRF